MASSSRVTAGGWPWMRVAGIEKCHVTFVNLVQTLTSERISSISLLVSPCSPLTEGMS